MPLLQLALPHRNATTTKATFQNLFLYCIAAHLLGKGLAKTSAIQYFENEQPTSLWRPCQNWVLFKKHISVKTGKTIFFLLLCDINVQEICLHLIYQV